MTSADVAADVYLEHRGALFGLAYRMLGSVSDAEDVVSDAYLRWQGARADGASIDDPKAYLFTITARLSIDQLRSVRRTRVDYIGTCLPEPLVTDWSSDPAIRAEVTDTLSLGLLREAFDYPDDETAQLLELSPATVRQHYRRARQRLSAERAPHFVASRDKQDELMQRFLVAMQTGEVQPLADLLASDAVLYADGGGKASAIRQPAHGHLRANGDPAILVRTPTEVLGVYAFEVDPAHDVIRAVHAVRNPDKLSTLSVA